MSDPLGRPPAILLVPAALATALLVVPLVAMVAAVDWAGLGGELRSEPLREALRLSLVTSTAAMLICLVLGLPLAWLLARVDFAGRGVLRALVTVPLVLPPVVAGVALRTAFGRTGVIGEPLLALTGFSFPFTVVGRGPRPHLRLDAVRGDRHRGRAPLRGQGVRRRGRHARRHPVDHLPPGDGAAGACRASLAGMVLGWARSLGEFGATITFNGNYPGTTQTMPTLIYVTRQADQEAALALSLVMLAVSIGVLLLLRDRWLGTP